MFFTCKPVFLTWGNKSDFVQLSLELQKDLCNFFFTYEVVFPKENDNSNFDLYTFHFTEFYQSRTDQETVQRIRKTETASLFDLNLSSVKHLCVK